MKLEILTRAQSKKPRLVTPWSSNLNTSTAASHLEQQPHGGLSAVAAQGRGVRPRSSSLVLCPCGTEEGEPWRHRQWCSCLVEEYPLTERSSSPPAVHQERVQTGEAHVRGNPLASHLQASFPTASSPDDTAPGPSCSAAPFSKIEGREPARNDVRSRPTDDQQAMKYVFASSWTRMALIKGSRMGVPTAVALYSGNHAWKRGADVLQTRLLTSQVSENLGSDLT